MTTLFRSTSFRFFWVLLCTVILTTSVYAQRPSVPPQLPPLRVAPQSAPKEPLPATDASKDAPATTGSPLRAPVVASPGIANPVGVTPGTTGLVTATMVEAQQKELLSAAGDDEETQTKINDILNSALSHITRRDDFATRVTANNTITQNAAERVKEWKSQLTALESAKPRLPAATASLSELEVLATQLNQQVEKLKAEIEEIQNSVGTRTARAAAIRERIAAVESEFEATQTASAAAIAGEKPIVGKARQLETLAKRQMLEAERPALLSDLVRMDAREVAGSATVELDLLTKQMVIASDEAKLVTEAAQKARATEAQDVVEKARRNVGEVNPALRELAQSNSELAEKNQGLAGRVADAEARKKRATAEMDQLTADYRSVKNKVKSIGLPASVGAILRKNRMSLPQIPRLQAEIVERRKTINELQLELIDVSEERLALSDAAGYAERKVDKLIEESGLPASVKREDLIEEATVLAEQRRDVLDPYTRSVDMLFNALTDTSVTQESIRRTTNEFAAYIDERVLWIRSAEPVSFDSTIDFDGGLRWTQSKPWSGTVAGLMRDAGRLTPLYGAATLFWVALLVMGWPLKSRLIAFGDVARKSTCQSFVPTVRATLISVLLALRFAAPLAFIAWRLRRIATNADYVILSKALAYTAIVAFGLDLFRVIVRPGGLAESHLEWSESTVRALRKQLSWLSPLATILVFSSVLLIGDENLIGPGNIERFCFVIVCGLASLFFYRVMHPRRGIPANYLSSHTDGWIDRLQFFWFWTLVAMPVFIGLLSASGFVYTANQFAWRLFATIMLVSLAVLLFALISRAILVVRRSTYIKEARQRRAEAAQRAAAEAAAAAETDSSDAEKTTTPTPTPKSLVAEVSQNEDPLADLRSQTIQARRLTAGIVTVATLGIIWIVWHDIVPALGFLENWPLWTSTRTITEMVPGAGDVLEVQIREVPDPVTIVELILALLVMGLSFVAARDIPGVAEMTVLSHLPLEKSVRYAIKTLTSYAIVLLGIIVACKIIGLRWGQIQWMATALTFGLAFGLQEMFANFVAGIIILFERPVRVGDIVTLDGVSGVVSRVRIRATTITNWDRQDFIVPNKDFITGRVLNWTLSDYVNRIVVNVGVAYGSDTKLTQKLLREVAENHPVIVSDPPPVISFEEFSDSSLKFVLRSYIAIVDMPSRLRVVHDLHMGIDEAFREAGIVIAFPQQDIHLHQVEGGFGPVPQPNASNGASNGSRDANESVDSQ